MKTARTIQPSELIDGIHVWMAHPEQVPSDSWYESLSPAEHHRAEEFGHDRARDTFVAARSLLRWILSHYGDVSPEAWRFVSNDHGRPELAADQKRRWQLRFNVSHTEGMIACIVSRGPDVGVDVEYLRRRSRTDKIAHRYFATSEVEQLDQLPDDERRARFFELWTLKEAYIKARGLGLAIPLSCFGFEIEGPTLDFWTDPSLKDPAQNWQFGLLSPPGDQHRVAVAVDLTPTVEREQLSPYRVRCLEFKSGPRIQELRTDWIAGTHEVSS